MLVPTLKFFGILMLLASPVVAQFGVRGGWKKGGSFQELNEQAKQTQDGTGAGEVGMPDMGDLQKMMRDLDPKMLEEMAQLGSQFDNVMKIMAEMSPKDLEKQMQDAMEMLSSGDMMQNMMQH